MRFRNGLAQTYLPRAAERLIREFCQKYSVMFISVITPYVLLISMLIRGLTLSGASQGLEFFFGLNGKADWSHIYRMKTWVAAATQIFFSTGIGLGKIENYLKIS